ncbi:MAG TPA: class I adenylate-forming enzyme family protein [Bauldia sp.]
MRIEQFLSESAQRRSANAALVVAGRSHSYRELAYAAGRVAAGLTSRGIGRGDRVAIVMDNSFAAVATSFAVLIAGGVVCAVDPLVDFEALRTTLGRLGAIAVATEARFASAVGAALATTTTVRLVLLSGGDRSTASASCLCFENLITGIGSPPVVPRAGAASDPAVVLRAADSGNLVETTLTHADLVAAAWAVAPCVSAKGLRSIFSHHGFSQLLAAIRTGATVALESSAVFSHSVFGAEGDEPEAAPALAG